MSRLGLVVVPLGRVGDRTWVSTHEPIELARIRHDPVGERAQPVSIRPGHQTGVAHRVSGTRVLALCVIAFADGTGGTAPSRAQR